MSIAQMPKKPTVHMDQLPPKPKRSEPTTFRDLLTDHERKTYLIGFLRDLSKKKGPWREYYEFFTSNLTGDVETMNAENRKKADKIVKEVTEAYETENE